MTLTHKATMEEYKMREMIKAAEKIRNHQNEFSSLLEARRRLPVGLQDPALQRLRDVGRQLAIYREEYPWNFPRGSYPGAARERAFERRIS